jgi:mannose-6-phosphate isomerase
MIYPLTFAPVFKDYPWGGRNLATRLGRTLPAGIVAESWEIAAHPNGASVATNGVFAGKTLPQVMELLGEQLVGQANRQALAARRFPLLVKLLDANQWLSVQVHPDDSYALVHEGESGKTEMWIVLHAEPGAELIYGFQRPMTGEEFAQAIRSGRIEELLHRVPMTAGDVIFVPAGAIHALGPGLIVAEIQQNSDTTYRIYDWGRPRPLHIEKALDVLDFELVRPGPAQPQLLLDRSMRVEQLAACPYFVVERLSLRPNQIYHGLCSGDTMEIWGVLAGAVTVKSAESELALEAVGWTLLPAALGAFSIHTHAESTLLRVYTPYET